MKNRAENELKRQAERREPGHIARVEVELAKQRDRRLASSNTGLGYEPTKDGARAAQIAALCEEARLAEARGDATTRDQCTRTLDDLMGHWVDGVFVGGEAVLARGSE